MRPAHLLAFLLLVLIACGRSTEAEPQPTAEGLDPQFVKDVLQSKTPVLVDFWAPWCGPCRLISPIVEEFAEEYAGKLKVTKVNHDEAQDVIAYYGIRSLPTLIVFRDGVAHRRFPGVPKNDAKATLKAWLDEALQ